MSGSRGVAVREAVERLPPYRGLSDRRPRVRLDGNENPWGPSPLVRAALADVDAERLARYPAAGRLRRRWARHLGVRADHLLLASGSGPGLALAAELVLDAGDGAVVLEPSFELYAWAVRRRAATVVAVPCRPGRPFPRAAYEGALARSPRLAFIGLPDNPTGVGPSVAWILSVARRFPGTLFVVDEAYHEFCGRSVVTHAPRLPNLLVARTLSKAYGLAGVRVGCLVGARRVIEQLHRINVPYPVTGPAVTLALAALADGEHVARTVRAARREARRMTRALRGKGYAVSAPPTNFVLVRLPDGARAQRLVAALAAAGVAVRDRSHLPGMAGVVRISCGTPEETDHLLSAMPAVRGRRRPRRAR